MKIILERFHRNTQTIGSVRFLTCVEKNCSACDRSDQNHGFEAQGPLIFEYHNRGDIMGTFTWARARTYNFSRLSVSRTSINVVRCVVKKWSVRITPFLESRTEKKRWIKIGRETQKTSWEKERARKRLGYVRTTGWRPGEANCEGVR